MKILENNKTTNDIEMKQHEKYKWMVCVHCATYNHALYIKDTLNSFCKQETRYPYVCVVVDDASTDGEQEIIKNFIESKFDLSNHFVVSVEETDDYLMTFAQHNTNKNCFIAFYQLKYNHGSIKKSRRSYYKKWDNEAEFIAMCEGDDYWIHPQKLQKQVDYLESHPECIYLFTDRYIDHEKLGIRQEIRYKKNIYSRQDILSGFIPGLQTVLFRRELLDSPILQTKGINGDRLYAYAASTIGEVHCLHEITAVYRNTGKGVSTSVSQDAFFNHVVSDMMRFHRNLNEYDWMAYCKGQSKNLGTYGAGLPKWKRLFGVYAAFRRIDNRISFLSFLLIFSFFIKNKISTRFNFNDPKEYNVR